MRRRLVQQRRGVVGGRRGCRREQDGFALIAVLAIIALTALVIGALLGLASTTLRATSEQERGARELRAADSAVEAAVAQMRTRPGPNLQDPCSVEAPGFLDTIAFGDLTSQTADDLTVSLDCTASGIGSSTNTEDQVRLVGADGYQGSVAPPTSLGSLVPSLIHDGAAGLRFDSGVVARRGASVLSSIPAGPAVATVGEYAQGDPGPGATAAQPCGTLAPGFGPNDQGAIEDLDIAPSCEDATAENVAVSDPQAVAGFEVADADPAVPGGCAPVVQIQPGRYDATRSAQLNARLNGCPGATFHFLAGVFSFDVNDAAAPAADRHALRFGDATSTYVAGVLSGAADPAAVRCDTAQSGTTFVLSGRTEIRHSAGRLAICPAFSAATGEPLPAVYQQTSVPTGIVAAPEGPPAPQLPRTFTFQSSFVCDPWAGCSFPLTQDRSHRIVLTGEGSRPVSSVKVLVTGTEGDQTPNNAISARRTQISVLRGSTTVCSTGFRQGTPNGGQTSSFELLVPGSSCESAIDNEADLAGTQLLVTHRMVLANQFIIQPLTITDVGILVGPAAGSVAGAGVSAAEGAWTDLAGAADAGGAVANPQVGCPHLACWVAEPDGFRSPDEPFRHALALADFDVAVPAAYANRGIDPALTGLQVLVDLQPSSSTLPSEAVAFGLQSQWFRPEMDISATLSMASGQRCRTDGGYVNSDHQIALDLLDADAGLGACNAVLKSYSQLEGADLTLAFDMPCVRNPGALWQCLSLGSGSTYQVARTRPPAVAHVSLGLTTDDYNGPPPTSMLTVDTAAGPALADPHVAGDVWMPASDLDLRWNGAARTDRPLVAGDLVLNGLASVMGPSAQMGIVCCDATRPDTRTVRLTAALPDRDDPSVRVDRLAVTVRFNDIDPDPASGGYSAGHSVDVLEWTSCRGANCEPPPDP